MSEAINDFFANVGAQLADKIPQVDDTPTVSQDFEMIPPLVLVSM